MVTEKEKVDERTGKGRMKGGEGGGVPCLTAPLLSLRSTVKAWGPMDSPTR